MQISTKQCLIRKIRSHELEEAIHVFMRAFRRTDDEMLFQITKTHWKNWQSSGLAEFYGAFLNDRLIAICLCFAFKRTASLGYMSVDLSYQHQGVGRSLLEYIIHDLEQKRIFTIRLYATKMGEGLYNQHSFKEDYIGSIYELNFREEINLKGLKVRTSSRIWPWIYSLDKEVYGDDRTKLLRFLIKNSRLIVKGRHGFAFIRNDTVGPVIAKNIPIFIDLLKYAYILGAKKLCYLTHDSHSLKVIDILHLVENTTMRCKRMIRGPPFIENLSLPYAMYNFAIG